MFDKFLDCAAIAIIITVVCPASLCSLLLCIELVEVLIASFN